MSAPHRYRYTMDDGVTLVADAWGNASQPTVLLQHGGGQTRHAWGGTARALAARGWHAVTVDLRGHGESDWSPDGDYTLERYARDTLALAGDLGRRPAVVGASLGGLAALLGTGLSEGSPFAAVVLVDITPRMDVQGATNVLGFMRERAEEGFATLEEAADAIAAYLPHRPRPRDLSGLRKNLRQGEDRRWRWHWDPRFLGARGPGVALRQGALDAATRRLAVPTLLVRGRLSELVNEEHAREFLAAVPHARYVDVSEAGHMVAGDRNDVFTEAVASFLDPLREAA
jgi:pimeloyl-ACP methyl ester carboxylesterase